MPIIPDTKDWTWVLRTSCGECGFDPAAIDDSDSARLIRRDVKSWRSVLAGPTVTRRPDPGTWSPLEYAAHMRDVYRLFLSRLRLMLTENDPVFASWDQNEAALEQRYNEQAPSRVSDELADAAAELALAFASVSGDAWARTGRRGDGMRFTVSSFARYLLHEQVHHLWDVRG